MIKGEHPSRAALESWAYGKKSALLVKHLKSCEECKSYIDSLDKHPSRFALQSWTIGEQTDVVEHHIQSCAECRSYVDDLEIDRQEFLETEDSEEFLNRRDVALVIAKQIKANKQRRRRESRAELSDSLPYDAENPPETPEPTNPNVININPKNRIMAGLFAIAAALALYFLFFKTI